MVESEKALERKLKQVVEKELGGWCLKFLPFQVAGLPDRLCLLPEGRLFFAEVKTTKKEPSKIQKLIHRRLRRLGFKVEIIDQSQQIETLLTYYKL